MSEKDEDERGDHQKAGRERWDQSGREKEGLRE